MNVQMLPTGKTFVEYGVRVEYQSSILIDESFPSLVSYQCAKTLKYIGKVYKTADGRWWLSTRYMRDWAPVKVFSKIKGFLLLLNLHKQASQ
jgi:hypothetical protein